MPLTFTDANVANWHFSKTGKERKKKKDSPGKLDKPMALPLA